MSYDAEQRRMESMYDGGLDRAAEITRSLKAYRARWQLPWIVDLEELAAAIETGKGWWEE